MGDEMTEPLSKLTPPSDIRVDGPMTQSKGPQHTPRLEWVVSDLNLMTMPITEQFLPGIWKRMHDDDTFGMFFHEGPDMTFGQFLQSIASPGQIIQIVCGHDKDGNAKEHAGLLMLNHMILHDKVKRAAAHFCFFREYWNRHDSADIAFAAMQNWFDVKGFDTLVGTIPKQNRSANQFVKRCGWQVLGDVPMFTIYQGEPSAATVSYMTRSMWNKLKG